MRVAQRRYQEGSVSLRGTKDPVWTLRYLADEIVDGQIVRIQKRVVLGTQEQLPTKQMAQRVAAKYLTPINGPGYRPRHVLTFADFVDKWRNYAIPGYKPSVVKEKNSQLKKHIVPYFGAMPIHEITTETVQNFISDSVGPISVARIQSLVVTVGVILTSARELKYTEERIERLHYPREEKEEQPWFTVEQIKQIIQATDEPYATLFHLLAETGMRIGEAFALQPGDLQGNVLSVRRSVWRGYVTEPKTRKGKRAMCISNGLAERLAKHQGTWIFESAPGRPMRSDNIASTVLTPLLAKLGFTQAGFHAFRHANATILDSMAVPTAVRQSRLGHANITTTLQVYTHAVNADSLGVAERFEGMFSLPSTGESRRTKLAPTTPLAPSPCEQTRS